MYQIKVKKSYKIQSDDSVESLKKISSANRAEAIQTTEHATDSNGLIIVKRVPTSTAYHNEKVLFGKLSMESKRVSTALGNGEAIKPIDIFGWECLTNEKGSKVKTINEKYSAAFMKMKKEFKDLTALDENKQVKTAKEQVEAYNKLINKLMESVEKK